MCQELQLEKKALKTQLEEAQQKLTEAIQSAATTASATVTLPADVTKVIIIFSTCGDGCGLDAYTGYTAGWEANIL